MKCVVQHERLGEILYEEGAWSGSRSVSVNGQLLEKLDKNTFKLSDDEKLAVKGNFFRGITVSFGTETVTMMLAFKWYEYILAAVPLVLILIWGNSRTLCQIIPIVGGAIGAAIGGVFFMLVLAVLRKVKRVPLKLLVALALTVGCAALCCAVALLIIGLILT